MGNSQAAQNRKEIRSLGPRYVAHAAFSPNRHILHLAQICAWAGSPVGIFETALYFSITSYTTIGYGDIVFSAWFRGRNRDSVVFGWSTGAVAVVSRLLRVRSNGNRTAEAKGRTRRGNPGRKKPTQIAVLCSRTWAKCRPRRRWLATCRWKTRNPRPDEEARSPREESRLFRKPGLIQGSAHLLLLRTIMDLLLRESPEPYLAGVRHIIVSIWAKDGLLLFSESFGLSASFPLGKPQPSEQLRPRPGTALEGC